MSTFAEDIEAEAGGEPIEAVVIGKMGWGSSFGIQEKHQPGLARMGEVLAWHEARPLLDYKYDTGYGAPDCHAIYAWTASRVLHVSEYDGSTAVVWQPRNPDASIEPTMSGG